MQILKLRVYLWCKQKLFYLLFFPETLQSTIENVKLSETTVGNDVTVGRWTTVLSWYLCEASNSVGIRQLTQQCNLFDLLFLLLFLWTHQIVQLFDMIAKFPEAGITWGCCLEEAMTTFYTFVHLVLLKQVERGL